MKKFTGFALVSSIAFFACEAFAAPTYYTDRSAFEAAAGAGLSFESFEADFATSDTVVFTGFSVSETGGTNGLGQLRNLPGLVDGAITDGTGALAYDDNNDSIGTFFSFASGITAFGLDIATNPGSTVTIGGSVSDSIVLGNDVAAFWGVVDPEGITEITFDASGGPVVGFDAVLYGQAGFGADTANFYVTKTFSDGSDDEVDVHLSCNSGLPLEQDFTISGDGNGVLFVVTEIQGEDTVCEVTESGGPAGYTPVFNDGAGCSWSNVTAGGRYECEITNEADPASFTVTKEWVIEGAVRDEVIEEAQVAINCSSDILSIDGDEITEPDGSVSVNLSGEVDSVTVTVDTTLGATSCSAYEDVNQSGIETAYTAECGNGQVVVELVAGGSASCTITNTVFFEGIPTLSQYGTALMALLMLGMGFVGLRRFV